MLSRLYVYPMKGLVAPTSGVPPGESSAGRLVYASSKLAVHSSLATTGLKGAGHCGWGNRAEKPVPVHSPAARVAPGAAPAGAS